MTDQQFDEMLRDALEGCDMAVEYRTASTESEWETGWIVGQPRDSPDGGPRLHRVRPALGGPEIDVPITHDRLHVLGVMCP